MPDCVKKNDFSVWSSSTLIDYLNHPAYAPLIHSYTLGDRFKALSRFVSSWLLIKIKRAIRYEMIPTHIRHSKGIKGLVQILCFSMGNFLSKSGCRNSISNQSSQDLLSIVFRDQGCAAVLISEHKFKQLQKLSTDSFKFLERRRALNISFPRDFEASRLNARRDKLSHLFEEIESILDESGIFSTAQKYLGRAVGLIDVNPQINDPSDDFWRHTYPDLSFEQPSCAYLHRDASGGDIKVIFYMSDVGEDNGPFSYVVGSHRMNLAVLDDHIAEANDSNGMAATDFESRRHFSALPAKLRQKGAFGNDMLNGSPLASLMQESMWRITGSAGLMVMFDTKGVHRGGMVLKGERCVITCVLG